MLIKCFLKPNSALNFNNVPNTSFEVRVEGVVFSVRVRFRIVKIFLGSFMIFLILFTFRSVYKFVAFVVNDYAETNSRRNCSNDIRQCFW